MVAMLYIRFLRLDRVTRNPYSMRLSTERGKRELVEFGDCLRWKSERRRREVFAEMTDRRCPGDEENVRSALMQPCQRDLHGRCLERCCRRIQQCRLQWRKASKREVRHVGDTLGGQIVDESVVTTLGDVVQVLNTDDLGDRLGIYYLPGRDCAEADMLNQTLLLEFSERGERRC